MWILESSSELFQGRRMWLKPGKSYLFGRVKKDGVRFAIEHKTISRKHFIINVDEVNIDDVGNIHARTKITIEDQNSKAGTHVNGEHTRGLVRELKKEENYIKPGSLPDDIVIKWHLCVLTYNLLKKEIKAGVLRSKQERIKDLDIKVISEYIPGKTTHLVVNKRNTPKSLQALIDSKPLVAESYVDSLEYAATPSDLNEEENLSPLEQDFDAAWPVPYDHLPPPGREPTTRPAEAYKPNGNRKHVFENFTFVFLDQTQYDNLLPPITTGHGKALLYKIAAEESTSGELITYLSNAAGQKTFGEAQKDVDKGGVILVRCKGDVGAEEWTNNLINETSLKLDQRAIDQGEFLDAILANNASLLRRTVPYENTPNGTIPQPDAAVVAPSLQSRSRATAKQAQPSSQHSSRLIVPPQSDLQTQVNAADQEVQSRSTSVSSTRGQNGRKLSVDEDESGPSTKRARFMIPKKSRVFNFDDEFDPDMVVPYHGDQQDSVTQNSERQPTPPQLNNGEHVVKEEIRSSRKRPRSPSRDASASFNDDLDDLLPAAAAMKRRRLAHAGSNGTSTETAKSKQAQPVMKKPKLEKEINVLEVARAHRKAEDERAKKEQEDEDEEFALQPGQPVPVYDVETVSIDVPSKKQPQVEVDQTSSDRWDPRWNGRKNFKGFRRARDNSNGDANTNTRRGNHTKVIVPLVDAKAATYGIGDQYWDKSQEEKEREREKRKKASQKTTQSQSDQSRASHQQRSQTAHDYEEDLATANGNTSNGDAPHISSELLRLQDEAAEVADHAIDIDEPRRTRASDTQTTTATATTATQSTRGMKRVANGVAQKEAAKKQKTLPVTVIHDSDSENSDDMKFKFGSRRRGEGRT